MTSGLRPEVVQSTIQEPMSATTTYEDVKRNRNNIEADCQSSGITFIPVVVEADSGCWGPSAAKVFSELAKVKACITGELLNSTCTHLYQSLGITLHRENARAILRRSCSPTSPLPLLSAATTLQG